MYREGRRTLYIAAAALAVAVMVLPLGPWTGEARAAKGSVAAFAGGDASVDVGFRRSASNVSAGIELPLGCTITSAQMDIEGVARRGDLLRTYDFYNYCTTKGHLAWAGYVLGNYPPSYPYWNPYAPQGSALSDTNYTEIGSSDDTRFRTVTPAEFPGEYPFHLFMFQLPEGNVTGLDIWWEGYGHCAANSSTRGAEMFVWRNGTQSWSKVDFYTRTEPVRDRVLEKVWREDAPDYVDSSSRVYVLVYGKRSDNTGGPNPTVAEGAIATDYVRVNATFPGDMEYIDNPSLSVQPHGRVWRLAGRLAGPVRLGASDGLPAALQAALDAVEVKPLNFTIPLVVNVSRPTAAVVRLSNLSVEYIPYVNLPPAWGTLPTLTMSEDTNAPRILDLDNVTSDDHSQGRCRFDLVWSSTTAVEATIEERHLLSLWAREPNWYGTARFRINATDAWGNTTTSPELVVDVVEVNDPPAIVPPGRFFGKQDAPFHYRVVATDVEGDALTFSDDSPMFVIDPGTGEVDFTPTNAEVGLRTFNITVTDARGGSSTVRVEMQIENVNDPPSIVDPGTLHGRQGEDFHFTFTATDPDLPYGDILMWYIVGPDWYRDNLLLIPLTGELAWFNIGNDNVGVHNLTVQVVDGHGGEDEINVSLVIDNVNDPPGFSKIPDLTVMEDATLVYTIVATDPDLGVDPLERLTWTVDPPWFSVSGTGTFSFTARRPQAGETHVRVTVTDRAGAAWSQTFLLTVVASDHPPVIGPVPDQTLTEDVPWSIDIVVSDIDSGDVVRLNGSAPFPIPESGGVVRWTPREKDVGVNPVTLEATDTAGALTRLEFNLTVIGVNDAPTAHITSPANGTRVGHDEAVQLRADIADEENDRLTVVWSYRAAGSADWTRITTGVGGLWTDHPAGRLLLRVEVSDGSSTTTDEVDVQVKAPPGSGAMGEGVVFLALISIAIIMVVLLAVLLARRGQQQRQAEAPEEEWEPFE